MPLPGGPSDKAGNSYERRWTVFALVDLLYGQAQTIRIEVPGADGDGSEFRLMVDGVAVWHQAKRQRASGPWTVNALVTDGVSPPWQANLARGERWTFVSGTGADELRELADRSRSASSWDEFAREFLAAAEVRARFERLERAWPDLAADEIFTALQRVTVMTIGETEIGGWVNDRLRALVIGAPPATVAAVLAQLADESVHRELSAADVWSYLASHGVTARELDRDAAATRSSSSTNSTRSVLHRAAIPKVSAWSAICCAKSIATRGCARCWPADSSILTTIDLCVRSPMRTTRQSSQSAT